MGGTFLERLTTLVRRQASGHSASERSMAETEPVGERMTQGEETPSPSVTFLPGRIGDYEVLGEIARGGMGIVVKARQPRLGREVAVKIIREEMLSSPVAQARFRIEAEAAASLRHPNIVTVYEAGERDGVAFFSMELVQGESLDRLLAREGPMEPRRAGRLLAVVADAVQHAHEKGILHRDLKPANVLIEANDRPKVTDFGIALRVADPSDPARSGVIGTPEYMAPEQASGRESDLTPATDVYGLGAILYEMITGRPPHRAATIRELLMKVLDGELEPPRRVRREVPRDLEAICLHCLARDPKDRYSTATALAADLRAFLAGQPVAAARGGALKHAYRWLFRRPALAMTYAALALFFANQTLLYAFETIDEAFYRRMTVFIVAWALGATAMHMLLEWAGRRSLMRYLWATMDVALLTVILLIANGPKSPLVPIYLLILVSTGFRWRPWLTVYVTALCIGAFLLLVAEARARRPHLSPALDEVLVPVVTMIVVGMISAALIKRMRGLAGLSSVR